mmetsp:Transcript_14762/g.27683  ORF Transcript_14762/g.27683 Transcript_14762/m.27683 type:complete len:721 (-) Transcript_14762:172-2334(-)
MMKAALVTALSANVAMVANAECANACNGHGRCTSYDMCVCQRNWQANDCSERVCQFGLAHVDTPKGDLNHNNVVSGPDEIVVENNFAYPYGTTEKFPRMQSSDLADLTDSAHYYMECSNKGTCDRDTGECQCLPGYDGAACQRASCPGFPESCSGHGVCKTVRQLAYADNQNVYELWDRDVTMGCECDPGFSGPDCSERMCKYAVDQLYMDDTSTVKYATWDFAVVHEGTAAAAVDFHNGMYDEGTGYWAIRFFDMHGEDWVTKPIPAGASCAVVIDALNSLPNEVIPTMASTLCTQITSATAINTAAWENKATSTSAVPSTSESRPINPPLQFTSDASKYYAGDVYRIQFHNNPGKLKQPEIELNLDGGRPSLAAGPIAAAGTQHSSWTVNTAVWTDGQQGENIDYFGDHCDGVSVMVATSSSRQVLSSLTSTETQLLKACLGGADDVTSNNVEIYDWDHGSDDFPHLVKLVLTTTAQTDGGYYVALVWDSGSSEFRLLNQFANLDGQAQNEYEVYTTQGVLARTSKFAEASLTFGSKQIITTNTTADFGISGSSAVSFGSEMVAANGGRFTGDLSCENNPNSYFVSYCVNKTDILIPLSVEYVSTVAGANPAHINMYTVDRIGQTERTEYNSYNTGGSVKNEGTNFIDFDMSLNFFRVATDANNAPVFVYKFFPNTDSNYEYVAQCSNRGLCNKEEGLCECFAGYTGDACQIQASLAV